jgi:glycosyltransferase involved in cell wall biosynthesis
MKVLHVIDSLYVGGAQKLLVTYAGEARRLGLKTVIVSLCPETETPMSLELQALGVQLVYLPAKGLLDLARFWRLLRFIRAEDVDVLHTHLAYANILGTLCALLLRLPVVVSMHNVISGHSQNYRQEYLERFLLRFVKHIIAVGENVAVDYRKLFPKTVITLTNAVPDPVVPYPSARLALRKDLLGDENTPMLIAVGRLTQQKGFSDLIAAFDIIHSRFPQAKLLVAGDGDLREALLAETLAHGLQEHLLWLGTRSDVLNLLAASDIYVSSARWEGLSIAMLEAMSHGLALVATEVGDAPKVVVPGTGILVPPKRPDMLADSVCSLLADPAKARTLGQSARRRIQAEYGAQVWFERLMQIYASAQKTGQKQ